MGHSTVELQTCQPADLSICLTASLSTYIYIFSVCILIVPVYLSIDLTTNLSTSLLSIQSGIILWKKINLLIFLPGGKFCNPSASSYSSIIFNKGLLACINVSTKVFLGYYYLFSKIYYARPLSNHSSF